MSKKHLLPEGVHGLDQVLWPIFNILYKIGVSPNRITITRLILTPAVLVLVLAGQPWWAVVALALVALTDVLDGGLARTTGQVTELGKLLDPIVDKALIGMVLISVCVVDDTAAIGRWIAVAIMVSFEIMPGFGRVLIRQSAEGVDLSAKWWGKIKMIAQCVLSGLIISPLLPGFADTIILGIITAVTVASDIATMAYFAWQWKRWKKARPE